MSRIDKALGRAGAHGASNVELPAVTETISIDRYAAETPRRVEFPKPHSREIVSVERPIERVPAPAPAPAFAPAPVRPAPVLHGKLVGSDEAPPVSVEQYRRIAGSLREARAEHGLRALVVSSAVPKEGKTLTTANIALTLSQSYGDRVVIVDADLRRPSLHHVFGLPDGRGLVDVLTSGGTPPLVEVAPLLSVLIAGKPSSNSIGLLSSERMKALMTDLAERFDWIIIDTPPAGTLPDARVLSNLVDAVIFVIDVNATPYDVVQRAVKELGADRIVGTVLNRIAARALPQNAYYDYYGSRDRRS